DRDHLSRSREPKLTTLSHRRYEHRKRIHCHTGIRMPSRRDNEHNFHVCWSPRRDLLGEAERAGVGRPAPFLLLSSIRLRATALSETPGSHIWLGPDRRYL